MTDQKPSSNVCQVGLQSHCENLNQTHFVPQGATVSPLTVVVELCWALVACSLIEDLERSGLFSLTAAQQVYHVNLAATSANAICHGGRSGDLTLHNHLRSAQTASQQLPCRSSHRCSGASEPETRGRPQGGPLLCSRRRSHTFHLFVKGGRINQEA